MTTGAAGLPGLLDRLEQHCGKPKRPLPRRALDWIWWENAGYLVSDERREAAYRALEKQTGLGAGGVLALSRPELLKLAKLGGMQPDRRVEKWLVIAETMQSEFEGDLETALGLPLAKARRALKRFPGIGDPGADKILLFTKTHAQPALESNGLRSLIRLGLVEEAKSYSSTYRAAVRALEVFVPRGIPWLVRAHLLLRRHGQELCKNSRPLCDECPLESTCPSAE